MPITWTEKLRTLSFAHLYLADRPPAERVLPPHLVWQSPFVLADADEPREQLELRVARAGQLWLVNYDLRRSNELVVAHVERPWFMAFQRAERPDEGHVSIGPLAARVMRPSDGTPVFALPFVFREAERSTGRELWRELATGKVRADGSRWLVGT